MDDPGKYFNLRLSPARFLLPSVSPKFPKYSKIYDHQRRTPKARMDGKNSQ
nr:MAG TPA: hypothetical protein [Caudoviricetes sp.]DAO90556.1 MAG TPA: hypothetical protein [Caudoviricetes sp.]DAR38629.1 MAG TPA: hypothetical protein [Caudoviricetes sp.]